MENSLEQELEELRNARESYKTLDWITVHEGKFKQNKNTNILLNESNEKTTEGITDVTEEDGTKDDPDVDDAGPTEAENDDVEPEDEDLESGDDSDSNEEPSDSDINDNDDESDDYNDDESDQSDVDETSQMDSDDDSAPDSGNNPLVEVNHKLSIFDSFKNLRLNIDLVISDLTEYSSQKEVVVKLRRLRELVQNNIERIYSAKSEENIFNYKICLKTFDKITKTIKTKSNWRN